MLLPHIEYNERERETYRGQLRVLTRRSRSSRGLVSAYNAMSMKKARSVRNAGSRETIDEASSMAKLNESERMKAMPIAAVAIQSISKKGRLLFHSVSTTNT